MDTIRLPSNATEADILDAIADLPEGGTIVLPQGKTIAIQEGLDIDVADRNITIDLNGSTLRKAGDVSVIVARGERAEPVPVKLGTDASGNTVATFSSPPADVKAGSWVKLIADDRLPGDQPGGTAPSRMGEALQVQAVSGNTVTFKGALVDQGHYQTNVRAAAFSSGELVVRNGEIVGDKGQPSWDLPLIQLRSLVAPQIEDVTVRDGYGRGIGIVSSVNAELTEVTAKNLLDGSPATLGIGVSSANSTGTTVRGLYAEGVTHAADNNAMGTIANSPNPERYGGDVGMTVSDSVAVGTRNFAWSWHSEAVNGAFDNVMAFDSYGFLMGRGVGGEMTGSGGAGNGRGIMFYEYGNDDSRNIAVDDVTLRETENYSVIAANNPQKNAISNSSFESRGPGNLSSLAQVALKNTAFKQASANPQDDLIGTGADDMLLGGVGADVISAGAGNDHVWGGAAADTLTGGYGRDRFAFHALGEGQDTITDFQGGKGGDVLDLAVLAAKYGWDIGDPMAKGYVRFLQTGADVQVQVDAGGGGDSFATLAVLQNVQASEIGPDNLRLSMSGASLPASAPPAPVHDPVPAVPPPAAAPTPASPPPPTDPETTLRGTEGADKLHASIGIERVLGGGGADSLTASVGKTLLDGGAGDDVLLGSRDTDILKGGSGQDWLSGGEERDRLLGGAGDDWLRGGEGSDVLAGSAGYDTADYAGSAAAVVANLSAGHGKWADAQGDRYSSIENLRGTDFNDALIGSHTANVLEGGAGGDKLYGGVGADTLSGGTGADWLDGGAWADVLTGGDGGDTFYFASAAQAGDTVTDFQAGIDHFALSAEGFRIDDGQGFAFVDGVEATSAEATLLCDRAGGQLLWDADGTGVQDAVLLARLSVPSHFSQGDILIG